MMKAVQINHYSNHVGTMLCDIPTPEISEREILLKVTAAAVNPLELLILTGSVKLIQDYSMPLTLGNECSGIVLKTGRGVTDFKEGDAVYTRLPSKKIGAFAEYVAVDSAAVALIPANYDLVTAAAIPLTGLTAYQGITEELQARPGETVLITGGSGSFGQMAVPIAKALGLHVIVSGNEKACAYITELGADQYIDYRRSNYWEHLSGIDYVIDTLGANEFEHELSVLKQGGRILSLKTGPNKEFAVRNQFPLWKRQLFSIAGAKYDKRAQEEGKSYRFMFVRADGAQLRKITKIAEENHIVPIIDAHKFSLEQADDALKQVASGHTDGKVMLYL